MKYIYWILMLILQGALAQTQYLKLGSSQLFIEPNQSGEMIVYYTNQINTHRLDNYEYSFTIDEKGYLCYFDIVNDTSISLGIKADQLVSQSPIKFKMFNDLVFYCSKDTEQFEIAGKDRNFSIVIGKVNYEIQVYSTQYSKIIYALDWEEFVLIDTDIEIDCCIKMPQYIDEINFQKDQTIQNGKGGFFQSFQAQIEFLISRIKDFIICSNVLYLIFLYVESAKQQKLENDWQMVIPPQQQVFEQEEIQEDVLGITDFLLNEKEEKMFWMKENHNVIQWIEHKITIRELKNQEQVMKFISTYFPQILNEQYTDQVLQRINQIYGHQYQLAIQNSIPTVDKPEFIDNYNFKKKFTIIKALGKGAFGSVYQVKHKLDGKFYAIKCIKIKLPPNQSIQQHRVFREVKALSSLSSRHIVRYITCWVEELEICQGLVQQFVQDSYSDSEEYSQYEESEGIELMFFIQMEYCQLDNLKNFLTTEFDNLSLQQRLQLFQSIAKGVAHIHSKGIVHRDLKPANIFVSSNYDIKIGDLGLAIEYIGPVNDKQLLKSSAGTPIYNAPELRSDCDYNHKVDIYSLGFILLELLQKYKTQAQKVITFQRLRNGVMPQIIQQQFPEEAELIKLLTSSDPAIRPEAKEILKHRLFTN